MLLAIEPGIEVIGEAGDGVEARPSPPPPRPT